MTLAAIEERLPDFVEARDVVDSFHKMLRNKSKDDLEAWIDRAARSLVASFANGVIRDRAAVQNAITSIDDDRRIRSHAWHGDLPRPFWNDQL